MRAGAHQARTNCGNQDIVFRQFGPHSIREANQCKLARTVWQEMWHGYLAANRGYIDDSPATLPPHIRQRGHSGVNRPPEMDRQGVFKILNAHVLDWTSLNHAGIVDQHIDMPIMRSRAIDR